VLNQLSNPKSMPLSLAPKWSFLLLHEQAAPYCRVLKEEIQPADIHASEASPNLALDRGYVSCQVMWERCEFQAEYAGILCRAIAGATNQDDAEELSAGECLIQ
jgi:hypothetical protein